MKLFQCEHCGQALVFEQSACTRCNEALGYVPELDRWAVLPEGGRAIAPPGVPSA